jgi:hypothetical protein
MDNAVEIFFFNWLFGWFVTCVAATIAYPLDTVKRLQMIDPPKYKTIFKSFKIHYIEFGAANFWRGNISNCIRGWTSGLILAVYDLFATNSYSSQCYDNF